MHRTTRIKITELNPHLICVLCGGYYIDAATIIECLHSFCRTCIVRYLESSKYCPICDVMVHKTKPLQNVKSDKTLQDLVYKLVPGLYKSEMKRRRDLYSAHPEAAHHCSGPCEEKGDEDQDRLIYTYDEKISLSLELYSECVPEDVLDSGHDNPDRMKKRDVRYLQCPAGVTIGHLKKFIRMKFDLPPRYKIDVFHSFEPLDDLFTLMDVAYIYTWRRQSPLRLVYTVFELARKYKRKCENEQTTVTEKQPSTIDDNPKETSVAETDTSPMQPATEASPPSQTTPTPATAPAPAPAQTVSPVTRDETPHTKESSSQAKQNGKEPAQKEPSAPVIKKNTSKYLDRLSCQAPSSLSKGLLSKHPVESAGFKPLEDVNSFSNNSGSVYDFNDGRDSPVPAFTAPSVGGGENGSKGALKQTSGKKRKLANGKLSYIAESHLQEQVIASKTKVAKDSSKTNKTTQKEKKQGLFDIRGKVKSSKFNGIYTPHVLNGNISN